MHPTAQSRVSRRRRAAGEDELGARVAAQQSEETLGPGLKRWRLGRRVAIDALCWLHRRFCFLAKCA